MKVIDLLVKMANGEPLPNKIRLERVNRIDELNCMFEFNPLEETYINIFDDKIQDMTCLATLLGIGCEIVEEDNKIKKIHLMSKVNEIIGEINKLIDEINKLKEDK